MYGIAEMEVSRSAQDRPRYVGKIINMHLIDASGDSLKGKLTPF